MFFFSGFCGLLYQIVWVRLAYATYGVNTPVLSVVISIFMMGLALGSWLAGVWVSRVAGKLKISPIFFYALAELFIGLGAFAVPKLFHWSSSVLLGFGEMNSFGYLLASAMFIAISILPWCFFMGATFPLMMAFVKERVPSETTSFSYLYVANVLGALGGTFLTVIAFIELLGFSGTLIIGALMNFSVAFLGIAMGIVLRIWPSETKAAPRAGKKTKPELDSRPFWRPDTKLMVSILFLSGFGSMAMEVIWTRAFIPIIGNEVYSFGAILFTYLLSTWIGSLVYRSGWVFAKKLTHQMLLAWVAVFSLFPVVFTDPRFNHSTFCILLTIVPFCAILGYLTPKLVDEIGRGNPKNAGKAYAVNVIGCILGPLLASYLCLPWLGVKLSLALLAFPFLILILKHWKALKPRELAVPTAAILLMFVSVLISNSYETLVKGVVRRDYNATVICADTGFDRMLYVNGIRMTVLRTTTKFMAHIPLCLLDHKPENALTICFGMGGSFRSLVSWGIDTTAVELTPSVRDSFGYFFDDAEKIMSNPKAKVVIDDGRRYLKRTKDLYDVIVIDPPPPPQAAGCSLLLSKEFFSIIKAHLKKGGLFQIWYYADNYNTDNAFNRTILESFPYVKVFPTVTRNVGGLYYVASMEPIQVPAVSELITRVPPAAQADMLEWAPSGTTLESLLGDFLGDSVDARFTNSNKRIVITDDCPFNEYYYMRHNFPALTDWFMQRDSWTTLWN